MLCDYGTHQKTNLVSIHQETNLVSTLLTRKHAVWLWHSPGNKLSEYPLGNKLSKYITHQETCCVQRTLGSAWWSCDGSGWTGGLTTDAHTTCPSQLNIQHSTTPISRLTLPARHWKTQLIKWKGTALYSAHPCTAMVLLLDRTHTHTHTQAHAYAHTHACTHTSVSIYIYTHTHTPPPHTHIQTKNKQDSNNFNTQVIQCKMQGVGTSPHQKSSTTIRYKSAKSMIYQFYSAYINKTQLQYLW